MLPVFFLITPSEYGTQPGKWSQALQLCNGNQIRLGTYVYDTSSLLANKLSRPEKL
jgi:hypothetical protein